MIEIGSSTTFENLTMYPLLGISEQKLEYITLDEALAAKTASVTEVSESGSVPDLLFRNDGDIAVLLLDGEELIGAKQNRVLNLSILAPANKTITIPVSCVEAGRWSRRSPEFQSSGSSMYAGGRAAKSGQVSRSMRSGHSRSDQGEVWRDISEKAERMAVVSGTSAMSDIYESRREKLGEYLTKFEIAEQQVGAMFEIDGAVAGLDLFDKAKTLSRVLPKLVRSCALDAVEASSDQKTVAAAERGSRFVGATARAGVERFPATGLGEDLRLTGRAVSGGALNVDGAIVHLYAFPVQSARNSDAPDRVRSRIRRASMRRRSQ
ncbi:MAG: hypothetical protein HQ495_05565 [Alphaproteobacteria bacterium]|nr:hypothetical protein [Alphaproteobacteria bacterium]